jgi:energy-coupling factor transporter ATP-binding protein EcfA2
MTHLDDFLGLGDRDLSRCRRVLFHGRSGSGKSTAIKHLLETQFADRARRSLLGPPFERIERPVDRGAVIAVDEIESFRDLRQLLPLIRLDATLLIATHVAPAWFPLVGCVPDAIFRTDTDSDKIGRYLARKNLTASPAAVREYCRRFGATYTDVDLILERYPHRGFDEALSRFLKFDWIDLSKRVPLVRKY